jgi:phospholipid/cholesterol/gamma-HCH transport system permease protein
VEEASLRELPVVTPRAALEEGLTSSPFYPALQTAHETASIALQTIRLIIRHPTEWISGAIVEASIAFRRCLIPLAISQAIWLLGFGVILFGAIAVALGVADREAGGVYVGFTREVCTWITMMIFAGVAGSANTADLGARKIREELDALAVLGVDRMRTLVVPRVMGMTIAGVGLALLALLISTAVNFLFAPGHLHFTNESFIQTVKLNIQASDLYSSIIKHVIMGFFIGVVSCQKGLSCKGGADGVGRAVNQTVIITFLGIWIINSVFNIAYLTSFPQASVLKG